MTLPKSPVGRRIQYDKDGGRHGWRGTVKNVIRDATMPGGYSIDVEYDNGVGQRYCIEALENYGEGRFIHESAGYLKFVDGPAIDAQMFTVVSGNGKIWLHTTDELKAHRRAESLAKDCEHGHCYHVCKTVTSYQRSTPLVTKVAYD